MGKMRPAAIVGTYREKYKEEATGRRDTISRFQYDYMNRACEASPHLK